MDDNFKQKYIYNRKHKQYSEKVRQNLRLHKSQINNSNEYINEVSLPATELPKHRINRLAWIAIAISVLSLFQNYINANRTTEDTDRVIDAIEASSREQTESDERLLNFFENKFTEENEIRRIREELANPDSGCQDENDKNSVIYKHRM